MIRLTTTAAALLLFATPAFAAQWQVDSAASTLTFTGKQAEDPFTGRFAHFTPVIDFDPVHPESGRITVTVDMASASIEDDDQNEALPTEDWFFTSKFPQAVFQSTTIRKTGEQQFAADGNLTIRGISKPVTLPFTLKTEGNMTRAEGELMLMRQDFGLGGSQWKDDRWIAYPVAVRYTILATPKK